MSDERDGPYPGDLLRARRRMRGWESDWDRGTAGPWIRTGDLALVLQVWTVGGRLGPWDDGHVRIRLLFDGHIALFSCHTDTLWLNWDVVSWPTEQQASGDP
jgi:hypothetical protein